MEKIECMSDNEREQERGYKCASILILSKLRPIVHTISEYSIKFEEPRRNSLKKTYLNDINDTAFNLKSI